MLLNQHIQYKVKHNLNIHFLALLRTLIFCMSNILLNYLYMFYNFNHIYYINLMLRNIHHHNLSKYFKYILYMDKYINYIYFHHNNILPYMIYNLMHLIYMMNMDLNMIYKLTHPNNIQMHNLYKMYLNPYNQNKDMYRMDIFMMINMFLLHIQYM